jgi:hypothetical protein
VKLFSVELPKGYERLSDVSGSDPRRTTGNRDKKHAPKSKTAGSGGATRSKPAKSPSDVGKALRSVYDATLGERVPDDFLDLLGKLS